MTHPLRLLHTSDWHLGHELHGHGREEEHDAFLAWLLDRLDDSHADALVITGDVFDVANPPIAATARFYTFLREATARCPRLTIVVVGGNHDSAQRINLPGELIGRGRVHLIGCLPRCEERLLDFDRLLVSLPDAEGRTAAWLAAIPFCRPGDLGAGDLRMLYAEVADSAAARAGGLPLVLTGHLHVQGGDVSTDSERRVIVGGEEATDAALLFDKRAAYVALGHLHRPQAVPGATAIRYAGSPIPLSASERDYRHSVSLVELAAHAVTVTELVIPRHAPCLLLPADGPRPVAEVEALLRAHDFGEPATPGARPFVEVAVAVTGPEPGLWPRVAAALEGKPVRLTRVRQVRPEGAVEGGPAARVEALVELQPDIVFAELHARQHAGPPADDLARAFAELLAEVEAAP